MANSPRNASSQPVRAFWRFTIREMLCLMVAVGACLTFWLNSQPVHETEFFRTFNLSDYTQAYCRKADILGHFTGEVRSDSKSGQIASSRSEATLRADGADRADLIHFLQQACETDLAKEKAAVQFRGSVGDERDLSGFILVYRRSETSGSISIFSASAKPGQIDLQVLRQESRD